MNKNSKKVLITGIASFVGNHLASQLSELGWEVAGYDLHRPRIQCNFRAGDLTAGPALAAALKESAPQVIFHLARLIKANEPERLFQTNLLGTVALFEGLLATDQHPLVVITSFSAH